MTMFHAVAFINHQSAQIIQFGTEHSEEHTVLQHKHVTRQHGSQVRSEHEFFDEVCNALDGITEIMVTGGHTGVKDFKHYVAKHRPAMAPRISAYEVVGHPTKGELVALARKFFTKFDARVDTPVPN
jgi:stalled ribosome rescue protein Dom34